MGLEALLPGRGNLVANWLVFCTVLSVIVEEAFNRPDVISAALFAFFLGGALSNLGMVPRQHKVYEAACNDLLPLTLVLCLLAGLNGCPPMTEKRFYARQKSVMSGHHRPESYQKIVPVGIAFCLGSFGTILGSVIAYFIVTLKWVGYPTSPSLVLTTYNRFVQTVLKSWQLDNITAAKCASCVAATYIGGSVNFFSIVAFLRIPDDIFAGLAAADLIFMGLYCALLGVIRHTDFSLKLIPGSINTTSADDDLSKASSSNDLVKHPTSLWGGPTFDHHGFSSSGLNFKPTRNNGSTEADVSPTLRTTFVSVNNQNRNRAPVSRRREYGSIFDVCTILYELILYFLPFVICLFLVWTVLYLASVWTTRITSWFEMRNNIPLNPSTIEAGRTALLTMMTSLCALLLNLLSSISSSNTTALHESSPLLKHEESSVYAFLPRIFVVSRNLSSYGMTAFFFTAGCRSNCGDLLAVGPAAIMFTVVTILVHVLCIFSLTIVWNKGIDLIKGGESRFDVLKLLPRSQKRAKSFFIDIDDVLVASNANIGGPGTAAVFAAGVLRRNDLVLAGTMWGAIGYAAANAIALHIYTFLTKT